MQHMPFVMQNAYLVPGIPFISFLLVGLIIRPLSSKAAGIFATLAVFASAFFAYSIAYEYFTMFPPGAEHPAIIPWGFQWLRYENNLTVNMGVLLDPISILLMVVVTTVSSLVHLYSIGYMHGDPGYGRFFTFLNLFTFSMLGLVVAPNILQIYVFWELVGVSSFLLIGFYYYKPSAVAASKKAFIVTRFADLGFLIGILILGYYGYHFFGEVGQQVATSIGKYSVLKVEPFDFLYLSSPAVLSKFSTLGIGLLTGALVLVYMGAAGKSAMFPLHIWLPDAMEGPTPVSALIHAATMVVAGVYLVARMFPVFAYSGDALLVVAYVGAFTCIFAAVIAITQDDIKRVLAFSTLSQLGYMMFALGVATMSHPLGYTASMFHLYTHAFFKALLFLGAGSIIHAVETNNIWEMGGLRKKMPITHITFLIATLAIAGVPPFAGFFSKDEIIAAALSTGHFGVFLTGLVVAGITAFYMFRIYFVSFWGTPKSEHAEHAHESPLVMTIPLMILALLSIVAGFVPMSEFVSIGAKLEHHGINWVVAGSSVGLGVLGIVLAYVFYAGDGSKAAAIARSLGAIYRVIKNKFYIDEIYLWITHRIIFNIIARFIAWFDRHIVDGAVNFTAWGIRATGTVLSFLQTGQVQTYAVWYALGVLFVLLMALASAM